MSRDRQRHPRRSDEPYTLRSCRWFRAILWYWSVGFNLPYTFVHRTLTTVYADTEIWCHEDELKHAFWSFATGFGRGPYVKDYLDVEKLNWKTFSGEAFELYQGVTLHHVPGHTIGGVAMELDLARTGCVVITGDAFHIGENYVHGIHPGTLTTDLNAWHRSRTYIRALVQRKQGKVVLGHDPAYFHALEASPGFTE